MEKKDIMNGEPELKEVPKDEGCQEEGKGRKAIKWVVGGLAAVATAIVGFILGRNSVKDDDDSSETTETTEE